MIRRLLTIILFSAVALAACSTPTNTTAPDKTVATSKVKVNAQAPTTVAPVTTTTVAPAPTTTVPPTPAPTPQPAVSASAPVPIDRVAAWTKVAVCEEGGWLGSSGSVYPNSLGINAQNWAQFGGTADVSMEAQIAVAERFIAYYGIGIPDQNGCAAW